MHADGVAQLPDQNAAEAVQRLPGVSVERDQGEGRFVSVRGLGPDLNSVTINGTLVPARKATVAPWPWTCCPPSWCSRSP